ncbi:1398_t:CDS:1 [Ambispora leptoticha]|uniref:1398_t:CDS:1 n=1 Tax=Ambispora leptoticha TaxID=144679 RepID=A0A9N8Z5J1_9GLOM|nr:1398_t:CDS:1 [Ambispora leptoticha]
MKSKDMDNSSRIVEQQQSDNNRMTKITTTDTLAQKKTTSSSSQLSLERTSSFATTVATMTATTATTAATATTATTVTAKTVTATIETATTATATTATTAAAAAATATVNDETVNDKTVNDKTVNDKTVNDKTVDDKDNRFITSLEGGAKLTMIQDSSNKTTKFITQEKSTRVEVPSESNSPTNAEVVVNPSATKSDNHKRKGSFLENGEEDNTTNTNVRKKIKKSVKGKQEQREKKVPVKRKRTEELDYSSESRTDSNASDDSLENEKRKKREKTAQKPPSTPVASKYLSSSSTASKCLPSTPPKRDSPNNPFLNDDDPLRVLRESSLSTPPFDYSTPHKIRAHEAQHQMAYIFQGVRFPIPKTYYDDIDDPNDPIGPIQPRNLLATFHQQLERDSDDDDDYTKLHASSSSNNPNKNDNGIVEDSENPFVESDEIIHIDPNDKASKRITEYAKLRKTPSMSEQNGKKKAQ